MLGTLSKVRRCQLALSRAVPLANCPCTPGRPVAHMDPWKGEPYCHKPQARGRVSQGKPPAASCELLVLHTFYCILHGTAPLRADTFPCQPRAEPKFGDLSALQSDAAPLERELRSRASIGTTSLLLPQSSCPRRLIPNHLSNFSITSLMRNFNDEPATRHGFP
jgi:hypothetical protein